jgi:hypothetical protein
LGQKKVVSREIPDFRLPAPGGSQRDYSFQTKQDVVANHRMAGLFRARLVGVVASSGPKNEELWVGGLFFGRVGARWDPGYPWAPL